MLDRMYCRIRDSSQAIERARHKWYISIRYRFSLRRRTCISHLLSSLSSEFIAFVVCRERKEREKGKEENGGIFSLLVGSVYLPVLCFVSTHVFDASVRPFVSLAFAKVTFVRMGNLLSSLTISTDDCIAASLVSSQLVHRRALSTCYDPIFDVSLSSKNKSILVSDDGRLRFFQIDLENNEPLIEMNPSSTKILAHDQVQDIAWSCELDRFLILTNRRLATFDQENNLVNLDLQLEKGS